MVRRIAWCITTDVASFVWNGYWVVHQTVRTRLLVDILRHRTGMHLGKNVGKILAAKLVEYLPASQSLLGICGALTAPL